MLKFCEDFTDIFALEDEKFTTNNFYAQKLRVTDNNPVFIPNYRTPHSQKQEIDRQIKDLIKNDLIEPSISAYNSPIILVPMKSSTKDFSRKNGGCDYRL